MTAFDIRFPALYICVSNSPSPRYMTACQNSTEELSSSQLLVVERQQIEVRNPPSAPFAKICFTTDYVEMIPYLEF